MLPAAARLRRRADFVATVRSGRRRGHGAVVVHLKLPENPQTADAPARVGFVVSRAVGTAVVRNRVRRRLQHVVRERYGELTPGTTLVVRALPHAADRSYAQLAEDFSVALRSALANRGRVRSDRQRNRRRAETCDTAASDTATLHAAAPDAAVSGPTGQTNHGSTGPEDSQTPPDRTTTDSSSEADSRSATRTAGWSGPARVMAAPIVAYRRWVSPALPARCRFHPSCSAYAVEALATHGAVRGLLLTVRRLLRCHPFHPGGYDPVPPAQPGRPRTTVTGASTCSTG